MHSKNTATGRSALRIILWWLLGLVVLFILLATAVPNTFNPTITSPLSRVKTDFRSLHTTLEAYKVDHGSYPAMRPMRFWISVPDDAAEARLWTAETGNSNIEGMTTPIAYLITMFPDPFSPHHSAPYAYYTDGRQYVLFSLGPDTDYDIDPVRDIDFSTTQPSPRLLTLRYDPTNGTGSSGDVWRVSQQRHLRILDQTP